ncbi:hypothetical protein KP509_05G096700 [Ceratopteris richardii]|uniref:Uncharacterized protein n=1 Tax=Ceratopteris richardii TaxID=49495 RepID=A0A8T2UW39_CERRI|nr:hypothetical protein KP509_05G096700 [Ceratopteris richardii]
MREGRVKHLFSASIRTASRISYSLFRNGCLANKDAFHFPSSCSIYKSISNFSSSSPPHDDADREVKTSRSYMAGLHSHYGPGKLIGKTALITGAGSGIGRHTAFLFAQEGASIVVADSSISAIARAADAVKEFGGRCVGICGDVSVPEDVEAMVAKAEKTYGSLHILFNNAGVLDKLDHDAIDTPTDVIDRTLAINFKGTLYGCKYGIPAIKRAGGGSVINVSSMVALVGSSSPRVAYTASKGAILSLTRELAVFHAREGIRVNALCPGPLRTNLLMQHLKSEEKIQRLLKFIPMGRFGETEEVAKAALFLASSDSSFMTGASLVIDGGITSSFDSPP